MCIYMYSYICYTCIYIYIYIYICPHARGSYDGKIGGCGGEASELAPRLAGAADAPAGAL